MSVNEMDEPALITEFRANRSEDAFAALVKRHVDFVYATALRQVGDAGLAEEITQNVFLALAKKAASLENHRTIAGWLYHAALNESKQRVRSELRRAARERTAAELHREHLEGDSIWRPLVPLLDEALQAMAEPNRTAVLLHCLEERPFREVGAALGVGEDAARKRVDRAMVDLTGFFRERGFAIPAVTAGVPLFLLATTPAPTGLAATVVPGSVLASALSAGATGSGATAGWAKLLAGSQLKLGIVGALVVGGLTTALVFQHREISRWREENSSVRTELTRLQAENERLLAAAPDEGERKRRSEERAELVRLRGEVSTLRRQASESLSVQAVQSRPKPIGEEATSRSSPSISTFQADVQANLESGEMLLTGGWPTGQGNHLFLLLQTQAGLGGDAQTVLVESHLVEVSARALASVGLEASAAHSGENASHRVLAASDAEGMLAKLREADGVRFSGSPRLTAASGQWAMISQTDAVTVDGLAQEVGPKLKVMPRIAGDGKSVELEVAAEVRAVVQGLAR